jgi:CTP:phosphocholine cytidylyltransferase-like protein
MTETNGLITIAIGKKYAIQAKYLAYSCMLHAPHIIRAVITDQHETLAPYYDILIPYNPEYGNPFATKTRLHLYTPFKKTLFLDADSLLIHNVDSYWEALENHSFAYTGEMITTGDWYVDIAGLISYLGISWIPKFNSGMFVFDKSEKVKHIFDTAFQYMENHKGLDVPFFRDRMLPDEPFLAIALAKYDEKPIEEYGRFSRTLIRAEKIHLDVIKGIAFFSKNERQVFPLVVHLCGRFGKFIFLREKLKLFFYFNPPLHTLFILTASFIRRIVKGHAKN